MRAVTSLPCHRQAEAVTSNLIPTGEPALAQEQDPSSQSEELLGVRMWTSMLSYSPVTCGKGCTCQHLQALHSRQRQQHTPAGLKQQTSPLSSLQVLWASPQSR